MRLQIHSRHLHAMERYFIMIDERFIRGIRIDWNKVDPDSYVRDIPSICHIKELAFDRNITFLVGENGTGKSTLLESIAVAYGFNPEGGSRNFNFSTMDTHSSLHRALTVIKGVRQPSHNFFLRAESFYNVATMIEEYRDGDNPADYYARYGGRSMHQQSHGESFLSLMQNTFEEKGMYILDEPEAALSPQRQLTLLIHMSRLASRGAQFIIASHSPILLGIPEAEILAFDDHGIEKCSYQDTESYRVTELFINNREYFLGRLLREQEGE